MPCDYPHSIRYNTVSSDFSDSLGWTVTMASCLNKICTKCMYVCVSCLYMREGHPTLGLVALGTYLVNFRSVVSWKPGGLSSQVVLVEIYNGMFRNKLLFFAPPPPSPQF